MGTIHLSKCDLEEIARKVLLAYYDLPVVKVKKQDLCIDPFILAQNLCMLDISLQNLSEDKTIYGLTSYERTVANILDENGKECVYILDGHTILIEQDLSTEELKGKFNFTLAHETAHHILKSLYPLNYGVENTLHFYTDKPKKIESWEEWQANYLASALLMPKELILKNMAELGMGEKVKILNRKYYKKTFYAFCALAQRMNVSVSALRIRMKTLGLIEKDYYYNPEAILDIFV